MSQIDRYLVSLPTVEAEKLGDLAEWIRLGLLNTVGSAEILVPKTQLERLKVLALNPFVWNELPSFPDMLFAPVVSCAIGNRTCLVEGEELETADSTTSFLLQLLPIWAIDGIGTVDLKEWKQASVGPSRMYSLDRTLWAQFEAATRRMSSVRNARGAVFAKSASYMGSKAMLAAQLCEILHEFESSDTVVVDLMCGSGAMSGAFAKSWQTIASDAQVFSCSLAKVQGGGMTSSRASAIADTVLGSARRKFDEMPAWLRDHSAREDEFIHRELTESVLSELILWLQAFDRELHADSSTADSLRAARENHSLFSRLYANLFFGVRQAYEIDCLRFGIDSLTDQVEKDWAIGALVCATSQCAFSYGGHFAQPKLDIARPSNIKKVAAEMLQRRSLSVSHEFYSRLVSLADESQNITNEVQVVPGPWQKSIERIRESMRGRPVCVYLDPPYTRDEYSRYYHVLETLVRYESGPVSGKGRLPVRGSSNRFPSPFHSWNADAVEEHIASILDACLINGWSCLWSYSSSGMASIVSTLSKCREPIRDLEVFSMDHTYKAQGKRGAKKVTEYAIYLRGMADL